MSRTGRTIHHDRGVAAPDFWKIRAFLRETFLLNDREELNWQAYRFEYWVWHGVANLDQGPLEEKVILWETREGDLAAVLNAEGKGNAFLQVHPEFRTEALEEEMISVAEERLWTVAKDGKNKVAVWAFKADAMREGFLERRGFEPRYEEHARYTSLEGRIPEPVVPPGFVVRPTERLHRSAPSGSMTSL